MYCAACGTPLAPGLSYCNRCGMSLRERSDAKPVPVSSYLAAITIVAIAGLCLMLGGAIGLKSAELNGDLIGFFMLMTFSIVGIVELSLCRQLSRLNRAAEKREAGPQFLQAAMPNEIRGAQPRALGEPLPSVTENTTRTLEYSRNKPLS